MLYLVGEVTVLTEGPLFQGGVYVSKGGCVSINLLKICIKRKIFTNTIIRMRDHIDKSKL